MSPPKNAPGISASPLAPARKNRTQPRLSPWVFLAAIAGLGLALAAFAYALMRR
ncbi:MAG: hypothetical protein LBC67_00435 [Spirochaetales bacterium]|nr:hypothetical protein [Spirochaetales bacterium]